MTFQKHVYPNLSRDFQDLSLNSIRSFDTFEEQFQTWQIIQDIRPTFYIGEVKAFCFFFFFWCTC